MNEPFAAAVAPAAESAAPPAAPLELRFLGRVEYGAAEQLQAALVEAVADGRHPGALLLLEHPEVLTVGRGALEGTACDLRAAPAELAARGLALRETARGGRTTWHGPGQLVGYPVLDLHRLGLGLHEYLRRLEEILIRLLAEYGLAGERAPGRTGVWLRHPGDGGGGAPEKIAALGVAVRRWVAWHGFALNVENDLAAYRLFRPCGLEDTGVTTLARALGRPVRLDEVAERLLRHFEAVFGLELVVPASPLQLDGVELPARFPPWLVKRLPAEARADSGAGATEAAKTVAQLLLEQSLNTVCASARCPNRGDCFARGTATFLILGPRCTRRCGFCAVEQGPPAPVDPDEPARLAAAARELKLAHVVITSVTRDDLADGGAGQFVAAVRAVRRELPAATVEVLTPDFAGDLAAAESVADSPVEVYNHNVETVARLYPRVRSGAEYRRSLRLLERAAATRAAPLVKSGLMLGLGERPEEVRATLAELRAAGVAALTLGQYLRPGPAALPVAEFVRPERFAEYRELARALGFRAVAAGPFVRSSYRAAALRRAADGKGSRTCASR